MKFGFKRVHLEPPYSIKRIGSIKHVKIVKVNLLIEIWSEGTKQIFFSFLSDNRPGYISTLTFENCKMEVEKVCQAGDMNILDCASNYLKRILKRCQTRKIQKHKKLVIGIIIIVI